MNRKKKRGVLKISLLVLLIAWMIICQFIMQFRVSDNDLEKGFREHGVDFFIGNTKIDGHNLHYAKTGVDSGSTLIFLHGTPGSLNDYHSYLTDSSLVANYRMISIDRPGFAYSDFGNTMDLEHQAKLISALIDSHFNNKPTYLIGHSLAGPLVVKLAAMQPSVINGIIILAGSVDPSLEPARWWRPIITYSPIRWMIPTAWRFSNEELYWLKDDLLRLKDDFPNVTCPASIFHGDSDDLVPLANVDYTKKMLVNAKMVSSTIFPGGDHFIIWNKYEEIRGALLDLEKN